MISIVRQLVIVMLLGGLAGGAWWLLAGPGLGSAGLPDAGQGGDRSIAVEIASVRVGEVDQVIEAVGTTRARQSVEIRANDAGRIAAILFETGQRVEAGQPLVRLDSEIEAANLAEARALLDDARGQLDRARQLVANRTVAQARVEELEAAFLAGRARVAAAERRLADREVTAPFGGVVGLREVDAGARITDETVLTRLDDLSVVDLEFQVPEVVFGRIRQGLPVAAASAAFPGRSFEGTVTAIDTRIDPVTRAFRVRALLPNPDGTLPAGLFMIARITLESRPDALLIPEQSVLTEGRSIYVYRIRDERAERVEIQVGLRRVGEVEVIDGLQAGDRVVIGGLQRLRSGVSVRIQSMVEPEQPPAVSASHPRGAAG